MRLRILVVLAALVTCVPAPAGAAERSWWAWLEELSGPGYFGGIMASVPMRCWGPQRATVSCEPGQNLPPLKTAVRITGGVLSSYHKPRFDNVAPIPIAGGKDENTEPVYAIPLHVTYSIRTGRAWDLGTGGGVIFFSGTGVSAHARPIWTPITVSWKFLLRSGDGERSLRNRIALEGQTYYIFPGFSAKSFSSVDNGFSSPPELKGSIGVSISFGER
jgi:hypothetical protein